MRPRPARTLEHLVEERSEVVAGGQAAVGPGCDIGSDHGAVCVHPAPFTSYAGRCSRDSLTAFRRVPSRAWHAPATRNRVARCRRRCLPSTRTVGQLVAETLKLYGEHWQVGARDRSAARAARARSRPASRREQTLAIVAVRRRGRGDGVVRDRLGRRQRRQPPRGAAPSPRRSSASLVYLPFPFLTALFVLPGLAWFALVGLAVPAAIAEALGVRDALRRGLALGRADYVHALGGLATLSMLVFVTQIAASLLLQGFADNSERAAAFLAGLVLSPVLFFGAALLYVDQAARVGTTRRQRRRLAARAHAPPPSAVSSPRPTDPRGGHRGAVPDADDADREGRPDAELESRRALREVNRDVEELGAQDPASVGLARRLRLRQRRRGARRPDDREGLGRARRAGELEDRVAAARLGRRPAHARSRARAAGSPADGREPGRARRRPRAGSTAAPAADRR